MIGSAAWLNRAAVALEGWLERERVQLPLWSPALVAVGIGAWFALPTPGGWLGLIAAGSLAGMVLLGILPRRGRLAHVTGVAMLLIAAGCLLMWARAISVAGPVLARPAVVTMVAKVEAVERLPARGLTRLVLMPQQRVDLPRRVRVNVEDGKMPDGPALRPGEALRLRARFMPPAPPTLPGAYDFARAAWFMGIGATGRVLDVPERLAPVPNAGPSLRERIAGHVAARVPGPEGAIAVTLATGDRGRIGEEDEEAMRMAGLSHLLSISGLHVTALVGVAMLLSLRLLALWPRLALGVPLILVSAAVGALAAIGYTLLTGAQVPTIRSCLAALVVLAGVAVGREAISLRTLAVGAAFVLILWPESAIGPSFQLSFTAVAVIVSLYESPLAQRHLAAREEARHRKILRGAVGLAVTGLAVEAALAPIVLFHFHRTGLLGMLANLVAIPLTEFVIMPAELLALLLDIVGLGGPVWWVVGKGLALILAIAHAIAEVRAATLLTPAIPGWAFCLVVAGTYWLLIWRSRARWLGVVALVFGLAGYALAPVPDLLVSGDGRHVALRGGDGAVALLRPRAGDYIRSQIAEMAGSEAEGVTALEDLRGAQCSRDFCALALEGGRSGAPFTLLVARSDLKVPWAALVASCRSADIVIASRRLPRACQPRWLKLDRPELTRAGAAAITIEPRRMVRARNPRDRHPWVVARRNQ